MAQAPSQPDPADQGPLPQGPSPAQPASRNNPPSQHPFSIEPIKLDADGCIPLIPEQLTPFGDESPITPWSTHQSEYRAPEKRGQPPISAGPDPRVGNTITPDDPQHGPSHLTSAEQVRHPIDPADSQWGASTADEDAGEIPLAQPNHAQPNRGSLDLGPIDHNPANLSTVNQSTASSRPTTQIPVFSGLAASAPLFESDLATLPRRSFTGGLRAMLLQMGHRLAFFGFLSLLTVIFMLLTRPWPYYPELLCASFGLFLIAGLLGCVAMLFRRPANAPRLESWGLFIVMMGFALLLAGAMIYGLRIPLHEAIQPIL